MRGISKILVKRKRKKGETSTGLHKIVDFMLR